MAIPVLIMGKSGSGKSASMRNFKAEELYLVNVISKPLPFKNQLQSVFVTDEYPKVLAALKKTDKKSIVIDDAGYLITNQFMKNHANTGAGNAVFGLYNDIADNFWTLIENIKALEESKIVYLIMHEDKNDFGDIKPKTIGKLLDEKVCIEGMFTIVLHSVKEGDQYFFKTKTTGLDVTKTPMDMFEEESIENDLKMVDSTIREYYNIKTGGNK